MKETQNKAESNKLMIEEWVQWLYATINHTKTNSNHNNKILDLEKPDISRRNKKNSNLLLYNNLISPARNSFYYSMNLRIIQTD